MLAVSNIRNILKKQLEFEPDAPMLEIVGASFIADEDSIFGTPNKEYIAKEIAWYKAQTLNVYNMKNPPKIWRDIAGLDGTINSNYGWCVFSPYNYQQYNNVVKELKKNPDSRRAIMIYNRPSMHRDATENGKNDFMCTNAVTYFIREGKLQSVVQMRSNDAVYGYKNDYAWQSYLMDKLCDELKVERGDIHWQVASLHVYPRHYYLVEEYSKQKEKEC